MKHSPGPWKPWGDHKTLIAANDKKMMIAETKWQHSTPEWSRTLPEAQANARLMATAPELLEQVNLDRATLGHVKFRLESEAELIGRYDPKAKQSILSLARECFEACQLMTAVIEKAVTK